MKALSFFNFLRKLDIKYYKNLLPSIDKYKKFFADDRHFERFKQILEYNIHTKKITENYIILYVDPRETFDENVAVLIYDPERDVIYCDLFYATGLIISRIKDDLGVLSHLYEVTTDDMIRVSGDLYLRVLYRGRLYEWIKKETSLSVYNGVLYVKKELAEFYKSLIETITHLNRDSYKLPYFSIYNLSPLTEDIKILLDLIKNLKILDDEYKKTIVKNIDRSYRELSDTFKNLKYLKIKRKFFDKIFERKYIKEILYTIQKLQPTLSTYINIEIDYPKLIKSLNKMTLNELIVFNTIFSKIDDIIYEIGRLLSLLYSRTLDLEKYRGYLEEIYRKVKLYKVNLQEREGRRHTLYFVGIREGSWYMSFTDIVVTHQEHGKKVVLVNGYNPFYIKNIIKERTLTLLKLPIMVFEPTLV